MIEIKREPNPHKIIGCSPIKLWALGGMVGVETPYGSDILLASLSGDQIFSSHLYRTNFSISIRHPGPFYICGHRDPISASGNCMQNPHTSAVRKEKQLNYRLDEKPALSGRVIGPRVSSYLSLTGFGVPGSSKQWLKKMGFILRSDLRP